jgi:hypothetical protein
MKNNCDEYELMIADALAGRLDEKSTADFEAHLEKCSACSTILERFERTAALLEEAYPARSVENAKIWKRVEATLHAKPALPERSATALSPWVPIFGAAAMLALAVLLFVGSPRKRFNDGMTFTGVKDTAGNWARVLDTAAEQLADVKIRKLETKAPDFTNRGPREAIDDSRGLALLRRTGAVAIFDSTHQAWRPIVAGERVPYGTAVRTGAGALAELAFGESRVRLDEKTDVTIRFETATRASNNNNNGTPPAPPFQGGEGGRRVAELTHGRLRVDLLHSERKFLIRSGGGSVELTGTVVDVDAPAPDLAFVRVLEGHVNVEQSLTGTDRTALPVLIDHEALVAFRAPDSILEALPQAVLARALTLARDVAHAHPSDPNVTNWTDPLDHPPSKADAAIGQLIVKDEQGREAAPLTIARMDVTASVRGPESITKIDQSFLNTTGQTLEGTFYFPLPPGAAISRYAMYVDSQTLIEGEVVERGRARQIFNSILRQKRDPALLEWMEGNLFKARIFPIAPHSEKRVILEYTQLLPAFYDTRRYVFPLVSELTEKSPIGNLSIHVNLATGDGSRFDDIYSPSFAGDTRVDGIGCANASASLNLSNFKPRADFVLTFTSPRASELFSAAYAENGEQPYVLMGFEPRADRGQVSGSSGQATKGRDVLFLVETSGARSTQDLDAQWRVLESMLAGLDPAADRVAFAAADVGMDLLSQKFSSIDTADAVSALQSLKQRVPMGGLDLGTSLSEAAALFAQGDTLARKHMIVFLGAGISALGTLDAAKLAEEVSKQLATAKVSFTAVAIGRSIESLTLSELSRRSGGFYVPLKVDEGQEEAAFQLGLSLQSPLIESPLLKSEALSDIYPTQLGSLLPGQEVFVHGRITSPFSKGGELRVSLSATLAGAPFSRSFDLRLPKQLDADPAVGRFWARARLDYLLTQPQSDVQQREVINLAQTWTLMSPYTSFLVLESNEDYKRYDIDRSKRRPAWKEVAAECPRIVLAEKLSEDVKKLGYELGRPVQDQIIISSSKFDVDLAGKLTVADRTAVAPHLHWKARELDAQYVERNSSFIRYKTVATPDSIYDNYDYAPTSGPPSVTIGAFALDALKAAEVNPKSAAYQNAMTFFTRVQDGTTNVRDNSLSGNYSIHRAYPPENVRQQSPDSGLSVLGKMDFRTPEPLIIADDVFKDSHYDLSLTPNEGSGDSNFRVRRGEIKFAMDIHENHPGMVIIDPAREAMSFPTITGGWYDAVRPETNSPAGNAYLDNGVYNFSDYFQPNGRNPPDIFKRVNQISPEFDAANGPGMGPNTPPGEYENLDTNILFGDFGDIRELHSDLKSKTGKATGDLDSRFPGFRNGEREKAEIEALRKDIENVRGRLNATSAPTKSGVERSLDNRYGPNGTTRHVPYADGELSVVDEESESESESDDRKEVALAAKDDTIRRQETLIAQERADNDKLHEANRLLVAQNDEANLSLKIDHNTQRDNALKTAEELARQKNERAYTSPESGGVINWVKGAFDRRAANETAAAASCKAFAEAEEIFHRTDYSGNGCLKYATSLSGAQSLINGKVAGANSLGLIDKTFGATEGQPATATPKGGYVFTVQPQPGAVATGGTRTYVVGTNMTLGYAMTAMPGAYDNSGREDFSINGNVTVSQLGQGAAAVDGVKYRDGWALFAEKPQFQQPGNQKEDKGRKTPGELTRDEIDRILETLKTSPEQRLQLYMKLAQLSSGIDVYRALADGIAAFNNEGPQAEALARELLQRIRNERDATVLDEVLDPKKMVGSKDKDQTHATINDSGLRAHLLARRAELERDAALRCEFCQRAYAESENDPAYLRPLVESYLAGSQNRPAVAYVEDSLRKGVAEAWMYPTLARAYAALGDKKNALRALTQNVALRPREAAPRQELAHAFDALGRGADAVRELRAACEFAFESAVMHRELLAMTKKYHDNDAREWALLAMLGSMWLSQDGDVWGEARTDIDALARELTAAGEIDRVKDLAQKRKLAEANDIVAVMKWDTNHTDIDLHVVEPGDQRVSYNSRTSFRGGMLDHDNTAGYGPETYTLKRGAPGHYLIKVHFYGGIGGPTNVTVTVSRKQGTPVENVQTFNVKLNKPGDEAKIIEFDVEK